MQVYKENDAVYFKGALKNCLFAQPLRYSKKFILGILTICLR